MLSPDKPIEDAAGYVGHAQMFVQSAFADPFPKILPPQKDSFSAPDPAPDGLGDFPASNWGEHPMEIGVDASLQGGAGKLFFTQENANNVYALRKAANFFIAPKSDTEATLTSCTS